jgi:hypothetical protein
MHAAANGCKESTCLAAIRWRPHYPVKIHPGAQMTRSSAVLALVALAATPCVCRSSDGGADTTASSENSYVCYDFMACEDADGNKCPYSRYNWKSYDSSNAHEMDLSHWVKGYYYPAKKKDLCGYDLIGTIEVTCGWLAAVPCTNPMIAHSTDP